MLLDRGASFKEGGRITNEKVLEEVNPGRRGPGRAERRERAGAGSRQDAGSVSDEARVL